MLAVGAQRRIRGHCKIVNFTALGDVHFYPSRYVLLKLADALDVSVDYLMGRSETATVAVACAIPAEFHGAVLKELEKIGISKEQIVTESPRAAVVGDGFIIDFVSPKEAMDISGLLMRIISNCSPDLSKSSDGSP